MATTTPYTRGVIIRAISIFNFILTQTAFHTNG